MKNPANGEYPLQLSFAKGKVFVVSQQNLANTGFTARIVQVRRTRLISGISSQYCPADSSKVDIEAPNSGLTKDQLLAKHVVGAEACVASLLSLR